MQKKFSLLKYSSWSLLKLLLWELLKLENCDPFLKFFSFSLLLLYVGKGGVESLKKEQADKNQEMISHGIL